MAIPVEGWLFVYLVFTAHFSPQLNNLAGQFFAAGVNRTAVVHKA